jgi:hypothetical protein
MTKRIRQCHRWVSATGRYLFALPYTARARSVRRSAAEV